MSALAKVKAAQKALDKAQAGLRAERASRLILCSCGKRHRINSLTLIVTHWYVEPHGCTGGDYWREGEWQFECPATKLRNRLMFNDWKVEYEKRQTAGVAAEPTFKALYRGLFAERRDVYERDDERVPSFNNYYVDKNRKRFELPGVPV